MASNYITGAARRPAVSYNIVMTIIAFCTYRHDCWQCRNLGCKLFRTAFQIWLIYLTRSPQQCSLELSIQMACIDYPMRSICMWYGILGNYIWTWLLLYMTLRHMEIILSLAYQVWYFPLFMDLFISIMLHFDIMTNYTSLSDFRFLSYSGPDVTVFHYI